MHEPLKCCMPEQTVRCGQVLHSPRVEGTRDGRLAFVGNADGGLVAYDIRCPYAHYAPSRLHAAKHCCAPHVWGAHRTGS